MAFGRAAMTELAGAAAVPVHAIDVMLALGLGSDQSESGSVTIRTRRGGSGSVKQLSR